MRRRAASYRARADMRPDHMVRWGKSGVVGGGWARQGVALRTREEGFHSKRSTIGSAAKMQIAAAARSTGPIEGQPTAMDYSLQKTARTPRSNKLFPCQPPPDAKDMGRLHLRIQFDVVCASAPNVTRIIQEIVHLISICLHRAKIFQRDVDIRIL